MIVTMKSFTDGKVTKFKLSDAHQEILGVGTKYFRNSFEMYYQAKLIRWEVTRYQPEKAKLNLWERLLGKRANKILSEFNLYPKVT